MATMNEIGEENGDPARAATTRPEQGRTRTLAVTSETAPKAGTPLVAPKSAAPKVVAPKSAPAPVKLTERQLAFLKTIHAARDKGYLNARKADARTIEALMNKKLIKKGAKDKASRQYLYLVSKAGEKHILTTSSNA